MQARLLLVDDDPELLQLLQTWFAHFAFELHAVADGFAALALAREQRIDLVLTDLYPPGLGGLHLLALLKELDPTIEVIVVSARGTMEDAIEALREGRAFDFLKKPLTDLRALNEVIERALARRRRQAAVQLPVPLEPLTERERGIMEALVLGLDNRSIGSSLGLRERTVKNHLTRIYEKLQVKNRTQAAALYQQLS